MQIILNGKAIDVEDGLSVADLVVQKKFNPNIIIVEYNHQLIKKDVWPEIKLQDEDRLEILQLLGGG
ncbi:sulfur carrier protein [Desulfotomaculum arcticum]|uniref:Sulfur carrier protein n=1 Tax=Desulfotruncus arcticus DSM 17038 TaxID=1121424 RepID=A0A1I2RU58_9FIRM|nr:sulfur carrier protein ThiS [Desulfotruncus arcticus]SFG41296.1 sulfur carrier protein [Desulfotomaculum arcticum] [Desulfotruncus arcticus DSM 17038]